MRVCVLGVLFAATLSTSLTSAAEKPNVIFILTDDLGWGDLGCYGHPHIKTPNLDKLAKRGTLFTQFYVNGSVCSPSRVAFMTGRYAVRTGMELTKVTPPEGVGMNAKEVTIAELLSKAGYATHHIGKWHMGDIKESYPINQGFDFASFPMHNQVSYSFLTRDAELDARTTSFTPVAVDPDYGLDKTIETM